MELMHFQIYTFIRGEGILSLGITSKIGGLKLPKNYQIESIHKTLNCALGRMI